MTAQVVAERGDLEPGEAMRLELDGADGSLVEVALVRAENGEYFAISDICSHGQVSLSEGEASVPGSSRSAATISSRVQRRTLLSDSRASTASSPMRAISPMR